MNRSILSVAMGAVISLVVRGTVLAMPLTSLAPAVRTSCGAVRRDCVKDCRMHEGGGTIARDKITECVKGCAERYDQCVSQRHH